MELIIKNKEYNNYVVSYLSEVSMPQQYNYKVLGIYNKTGQTNLRCYIEVENNTTHHYSLYMYIK